MRTWNLLGGIEWDGLPYAVEIFGVEDVELLIRLLAVIREHTAAQRT